MGRRTWLIFDRLLRTQFWPAERLVELQLAKLRRLLRHAVDHCPFYASRLTGLIDQIDDLDSLASLPLLTRRDVRQNARAMCWNRMPHRRLLDHSRGSTDQPLCYYWDRHRQAWDKANRLRGHSWHGFSASERELHLWPVDPPVNLEGRLKHWLRQCRDRLLDDVQIDCLADFSRNAPAIASTWQRLNPLRVTAYPSTLCDLLAAPRRNGRQINGGSLRCVFLTGEVAFEWQKKLIQTSLQVSVAESYGVQEVGAIAFTCPHGTWHVAAESVIIEVLRDGRPAAPGELGEIVATGLESRAMPMIRYCTGDVVRVSPMHCHCGLGLPCLPPVLGRVGDFLEGDDGRWHEPAAVVACLGELLENGRFQVVQSAEGSVDIRVAWPAERVFAVAPLVEQRMQNLLGMSTRCQVRPVSALERTPFGKLRYVQSARSSGGLAYRPDSGSRPCPAPSMTPATSPTRPRC